MEVQPRLSTVYLNIFATYIYCLILDLSPCFSYSFPPWYDCKTFRNLKLSVCNLTHILVSGNFTSAPEIKGLH